MFLDGPHVLQPADLAFGNSLESLEETGEAATGPDTALRGWGFKATPEDPEPGLVEALEVIKDALSKDTYVVRARNWVRSARVRLTFRLKRIGRVWFQPRRGHGCDCRRIGELHRIPSLYSVFSWVIIAGETTLISSVCHRWKTNTSTTVRELTPCLSCSELKGCSSANSVSPWRGIARPVLLGLRCLLHHTPRQHCTFSVGRT